MANLQSQPLDLFMGIILLKHKITAQTFHIKVQSPAFSQMQYTTGMMIEFYWSNPSYTTQNKSRKYAFWEYEPIRHTADFAVTFSDHEEKHWLENLQEGDLLFFKIPSNSFILDLSTDHYFLIGDVKALPGLYELNRALPVSKTITSLIYAEQESDIFPDLDHSFPLKSYCIQPIDPLKILEYIQKHFPKNIPDVIAYILGDSSTFIYEYLKNHSTFDLRNVYINSL